MHHRFEKIQKFSDPPLEICPRAADKVKKLVSSPAFQFKGTGWYITDYAKKPSGDSGQQKSSARDPPRLRRVTRTHPPRRPRHPRPIPRRSRPGLRLGWASLQARRVLRHVHDGVQVGAEVVGEIGTTKRK